VFDQAGASDGGSAIINGEERSRNLVKATSAFYSRHAIIERLARPEMTPLLMKPVRYRRDELTTVDEILDGHG
jgi:hypothetical protein